MTFGEGIFLLVRGGIVVLRRFAKLLCTSQSVWSFRLRNFRGTAGQRHMMTGFSVRAATAFVATTSRRYPQQKTPTVKDAHKRSRMAFCHLSCIGMMAKIASARRSFLRERVERVMLRLQFWATALCGHTSPNLAQNLGRSFVGLASP